MTFGELKAKIKALLKGGTSSSAVTVQDKMIREYVSGYNRAVMDVLALVEQLKKTKNGNT